MGVVEQSSGAVESYLTTLEETYGSFAINQRTVAVPAEQYEREREKSGAGQIDVHAKVENDQSEVLYVEDNGTTALPSTTTTAHDSLKPAIQAEIFKIAGIECLLSDISAVTILGVRDADNEGRKTVYRLAVLFDGNHKSGSINDHAEWKQYDPNRHPAYV